jgi:hypothetical protein
MLQARKLARWFKYRSLMSVNDEWRTNTVFSSSLGLFTNNRGSVDLACTDSISRSVQTSGRPTNASNRIQSHTGIRRSSVRRHSFFIQIHFKRRKHHYDTNIRPVFVQWANSFFHNVVYSYKNLSSTNIPLYLDVIESINKCDHYHEAISHLRSYRQAYMVYQMIQTLQDSHNSYMNNKITQIEDRLVDEIEKNKEITIKEKQESNEVEKYDKTQILNYFRIKARSEIHLEKENNVNLGGKYYSRLYARVPASNNYQIAIGDKRSIDSLCQLVRDQEVFLLENFIIMQKNIDDMNGLCEQFKNHIDLIIHDTDRCVLRGRCAFENDMFPYNVIEFFKRKRGVYPDG